MKKTLVFLMAVALAVGAAGTANAAAKYVYDGGLGTWSDADKTSFSTTADPDGWMCWAAAASNALSWAGWYGLQSDGTTQIATADDIFQSFVNAWPNSTGNTMYGYDWWFNNFDTDPNDNPSVEAGFYKSYNLIPAPGYGPNPSGVYGAIYGFINGDPNQPGEGNISSYIDADRALEISIDVAAFGGFSHALTVWGMDEAADILYFTDSDDGVNQLRSLNYYTDVDGWLWLADYTNAYVTTAIDVKVTQLVRLNRNDSGLAPSLLTPVDGDGNGTGVPEPSTVFLLGSGLTGLFLMRRNRAS